MMEQDLFEVSSDRNTFKNYVLEAMELNNGDIVRAIIYMRNHCDKNDSYFRSVNHRLTAKEKNHIICEILLPF